MVRIIKLERSYFREVSSYNIYYNTLFMRDELHFLCIIFERKDLYIFNTHCGKHTVLNRYIHVCMCVKHTHT